MNLVLPFVPVESEPELTAAFDQAATVRSQSPESQALTDLYFAETAVRIHRAGEGAPYTGLKPADTDFGPAIPAAAEALETGQIDALLALLSQEVEAGVTERFNHIAEMGAAPEAPAAAEDVPAARERVSEELAFIGYIEAIYLAIEGGGHAKGAAAAVECGH